MTSRSPFQCQSSCDSVILGLKLHLPLRSCVQGCSQAHCEYSAKGWDLDLMILISPFQVNIFYDSVIL